MRRTPLELKDFVDACRKAGLKATHQRAEIYGELVRSAGHPDAESIYLRVRKRVPTISFDTVYRTLRTLEEKGVISRVGLPLERARFDAVRTRHHHFVCTRCGRIEDFDSEEFDRLRAPPAAARHGEAETVLVEVRGVCRTCRAKPM